MDRKADTIERNKLWERYWGDLPPEPGTAVWDSAASTSAAVHLRWFKGHFPATLPLLDIGCGNGTQTAFLSERYSRVIGLDVSASAVRLAALGHRRPGLSFREFDIVDIEAGRALHDELGDCNVYIRTLLHLLPEEARDSAVANIARLIGRSGGLFITELAHSSIAVFERALGAGEGSVPKIRRNLSYGIVGANMADGELEGLLRRHGIVVLDDGTTTMPSTDEVDGGEKLLIPLDYVIGCAREQ